MKELLNLLVTLLGPLIIGCPLRYTLGEQLLKGLSKEDSMNTAGHTMDIAKCPLKPRGLPCIHSTWIGSHTWSCTRLRLIVFAA